jgi:hypothetical protein
MSYKEVIETTTTYPDLDEEDKKYLRDNQIVWRVTVDKRVTEEFVVEAYTKDEAEEIARNKSSSYTRPDGSEVEDLVVESSELDRCTYQEDEIEFIEKEVLNVT